MANNASGYWVFVLRALKEQGSIASVYTQLDNPDNFYVGFVEQVSSKHFALRSVTIDGKQDGWLVGRNVDIAQVIAGDDYEQRLVWLTELNGRQLPMALTDQAEEDLFAQYARVAKAQNLVVSIWPLEAEEGVSGFVESVDDLHITLNAFDFFGQNQGLEVIGIGQIEIMSIDALEERMFMLMHENTPPGAPLRLL